MDLDHNLGEAISGIASGDTGWSMDGTRAAQMELRSDLDASLNGTLAPTEPDVQTL